MLKNIGLSAFIVTALSISLAACANPVTEVVSRSAVQFQPLNPARGDASPKAGVLWGDIEENVPSGVLIAFADGFSSPPHIHNITYRAIVISGEVHNDDPNAESMWMGPGSFWTQPAGESHITSAATGSNATAFLEIMEGPYLVKPSNEAFDSGERPINVESRNVVWLGSSDVTWVNSPESPTTANGVKTAFLWGSPTPGQKNGTLLRLPAGSRGELQGNSVWLRAVVIKGQVSHRLPGASEISTLMAGSYFGSNDGKVQNVSCSATDDCLIYVSTEGRYVFTQR